MSQRAPKFDELSAADQELVAAFWADKGKPVAPRPEPEPEPECGDRRETWVCGRPAGHLTDDSGALEKPQAHMHRHITPGRVRVTAEWFDDEG